MSAIGYRTDCLDMETTATAATASCFTSDDDAEAMDLVVNRTNNTAVNIMPVITSRPVTTNSDPNVLSFRAYLDNNNTSTTSSSESAVCAVSPVSASLLDKDCLRFLAACDGNIPKAAEMATKVSQPARQPVDRSINQSVYLFVFVCVCVCV